MTHQPVFLGVDPGVSGAIGVVDDRGCYVEVLDMPTIMRTSKSRKINGAGLGHQVRQLIGQYRIVQAAIESVWAMPKQGFFAGASICHSVGCCESVLGALDVPTIMPASNSWKKTMGLSKDKEQCRATAQQLFPSAPLDRKKDADRAEALLLARYAWREHARPTAEREHMAAARANNGG